MSAVLVGLLYIPLYRTSINHTTSPITRYHVEVILILLFKVYSYLLLHLLVILTGYNYTISSIHQILMRLQPVLGFVYVDIATQLFIVLSIVS